MGALYGFAAVLGSLEHAGLSLGRSVVAVKGVKVFCFFLQKEALPSLWKGPWARKRFFFVKKNQKTFGHTPVRMSAVP
jgi:hypothetical protein